MDRIYFKAIPAAYVIMIKDDSVLLLRRQNTGYADGQLALPAGHIDGGELASTAAAREALEEVGVKIDPSKLQFVHASHRLNQNLTGQERIDFFFKASEWEGVPVNQEPDKSSEIVWAPLNNLTDDVLPYIQSVLHDVQKERFFSEYVIDPND